ncbi:hypothetical protein RRG08_049068 [Elysia crispata]|uniref:Uncharacterized protein n=1 Tax=Elysia crispata TaxID=231223 RepID=A0AAE1AAD5_9GAST|nr:hypothetical protein RRG08_049068 [Elysia crispata]
MKSSHLFFCFLPHRPPSLKEAFLEVLNPPIPVTISAEHETVPTGSYLGIWAFQHVTLARGHSTRPGEKSLLIYQRRGKQTETPLESRRELRDRAWSSPTGTSVALSDAGFRVACGGCVAGWVKGSNTRLQTLRLRECEVRTHHCLLPLHLQADGIVGHHHHHRLKEKICHVCPGRKL